MSNALYADQQAQAAAESARVKQEFLGTISHEFRTPLHAIIGYVDLLAGSAAFAADESARGSIERLRVNACRLQDLLSEMLWFAELRAGQRAMHVESVDLRKLFADFGATMARQLAGRSIRFEWEVAPETRGLYTDHRMLKQIVSGLLSNAVKFTQHGAIRLIARATDDHVEIAVADSGIGIDPKNFAMIFEEFRQIDASLTRRVEGLGLGLALVQELTVILGGEMEVDSRPDAGATFRVRLPMAPGQPAPSGARKLIAWPLPDWAPAPAART